MEVTAALSSRDLREFLHELDKSDRVEVTEWEALFVGNCMNLDNFTTAQRRVTERLVQKYADRIRWS